MIALLYSNFETSEEPTVLNASEAQMTHFCTLKNIFILQLYKRETTEETGAMSQPSSKGGSWRDAGMFGWGLSCGEGDEKASMMRLQQ